jgi:regulator of protease activity HflC (stomatin/prohibitin superfamily)
MDYIVGAAFISIISLIGLYVSHQFLEHYSEASKQALGKIIRTISICSLIGLNFLIAFRGAVYQVPAGHLGILYCFGAIDGQTGEGLQIVAPWKSVYPASTQVQSRYYKSLDSFSKETQNVYVAATVNFHVSPENIQRLYRTVGSNYADVLIDPRVYQDFKDATVQYCSVDVAPHREDIRKTVRQRITEELREQSIVVDDVLLNNISFSREFENSIENKQIQSQNALAEAQKVAAEHQKALQAVEIATGQANSALIKAQKEAEANRLLTKSITPELVKYLTVQKLAPNVSVMMIPEGNQFILGSDVLNVNKRK